MPERLHLLGLSFLYTIHSAALAFLFSPFLIKAGYSEASVGIVFAVTYGLGVLMLAQFPRFVEYFGAHTLFVISAFILTTSLGLLALGGSTLWASVCIIIAALASLLLWSLFDIGLEHSTNNENETGRTRAIFLSVLNIVYVAIPPIAGWLVTTGGFSTLFWLLAASTALLVVYSYYAFPHVPHPKQHAVFSHVLDVLAHNPDIRRVFSLRFMLQVFYGFMTIYMPLLLVSQYGFTVEEMARIFSIAIIAFIIVQPPVGFISDTWLGEKEIMATGFIILAAATAFLPLVVGSSLLMVAGVMFATRVGAAAIEITTESYFFKHVDSTDSAQIASYRILSPLARLAVPLLGTAYVSFFSITSLPFMVAAIIIVVAAIEIPFLRDTK